MKQRNNQDWKILWNNVDKMYNLLQHLKIDISVREDSYKELINIETSIKTIQKQIEDELIKNKKNIVKIIMS